MDDQPPGFAEFYLRLDDGRVTRGRTRLMYVWNVADWHLLRNCSYSVDNNRECPGRTPWTQIYNDNLYNNY